MDTIDHLRRMAKCSRFYARADRAVAREFADEFHAARAAYLQSNSAHDHEAFVDLRQMVDDKEASARGHERDAILLEKAAREMEQAVVSMTEAAAQLERMTLEQSR